MNPRTTLAVDPSKPGNNTGVAFFVGSALTHCWLHTDTKAPPYQHADLLVIELPQVYPGARNEDPNDLIQVARAVGQWEQSCSYGELKLIHPRAWKGTIDKRVVNNRTLSCLTPSERAQIPQLPDYKLHNVLDAIGLGLFIVGRFGRGGR
jgi:hypothetical protein